MERGVTGARALDGAVPVPARLPWLPPLLYINIIKFVLIAARMRSPARHVRV
jgi:hypothetical protein